MSQVFLSPHLDDAPLSCGGYIHQLASAGQRVLVVTVCAGDPPAGPLSDYALSLHARWGQPADRARTVAAEMIAERRAEDRAALERLGAEALHLDLPDVIYRRDARGAWLVDDDAALFAGYRPADAGTVDALAERILEIAAERLAPESAGGQARPASQGLYIPLGIGDHADHHLVRRAAERAIERDPGLARTCFYYEDYPYAADEARLSAAIAHEAATATWQARRMRLAAEDLDARIASVACYASQISSFWSDLAAMDAELRAFAARRGGKAGPAEVLWRPL
ncbi:MAG: PIG-L family deacetylase [Caldilineae bacterium]|nr:PIG-L family deacetylase [Chloroflexota bacterium]MCB9176686.1 PIG-L family deacetylase [Caldilineae bacterium]